MKQPASNPEQEAHLSAFGHIKEKVQIDILSQSKIVFLESLHEDYLGYMKKNHFEYYNNNYRIDKFRANLFSNFGAELSSWKIRGRDEIIFSSAVIAGMAIERALTDLLPHPKCLAMVAGALNRTAKMSVQEMQRVMHWPVPSGKELKAWQPPPSEFVKFISILISGTAKHADPQSTKYRRVLSICSDILFNISNGQYMPPKHILLGMTVWHNTGSSNIISLLNRFGYTVSYTRLLEILTSISLQTQSETSLLPYALLVGKKRVRAKWVFDNFDLNEETPDGRQTTHVTNGIIILDHIPDNSNADTDLYGYIDASITDHEMIQIEKNKQRSVKPEPLILEPAYVPNHVEPNLTVVTSQPDALCTAEHGKAMKSDSLFMICRWLQSNMQNVPEWGGWVTQTEITNEQSRATSQVEYLPPVNAPITENDTVLRVLKLVVQQAELLRQLYLNVTFDLAAAKRAYTIIWRYDTRFHNVIIQIGAMHFVCAYLHALGKTMAGSGYEEAVVQSGICASSSMANVLNGKHYNRAGSVLKCTVEAIDRILWAQFMEKYDGRYSEPLDIILKLAKKPTADATGRIINEKSCAKLLDDFSKFKDTVRSKGGKTPAFWVAYQDRALLLLRFLRATKTNNVQLHIACLYDMIPLFFATNLQNYARYGTFYILQLLNLHHSHPRAVEMLQHGGISANRSCKQNSRSGLDITLEQDLNKHASGHGPGWIGFSQNAGAVERWAKTRHARAEYAAVTKEMAGLDSRSEQKELCTSWIRKGELRVRALMNAFEEFINPFQIEDKDQLYCLSSGRPVTVKNAELHLLNIDKTGRGLFQVFIKDVFIEKTRKFHEPIKRIPKWGFECIALRKKTKVEGKAIELRAERNIYGQLAVLSMNHDLDMQKVMQYPLGPVPWALATADGSPAHTNKANLGHELLEAGNFNTAAFPESAFIQDACELLQKITPLPDTFGQLAHKVFLHLPNQKEIHFVADTYRADSIKNSERERRGSGAVFILNGGYTRIPKDFKSTFMANGQNKTALLRLILSEWKKPAYAGSFNGRSIYCSIDGRCYKLSSNGLEVACEEISALHTIQEEADTKIILHCKYVSDMTNHESITVRSPDTDVFILLLKFCQSFNGRQVVFDTGSGDKRQLIIINKVVETLGQEICDALPGLHCFTGCDTCSAFVRKGKILPLKLLREQPRFIGTFSKLGKSEALDDETLRDLEAFTCLLYDKKTKCTDIDRLRYTKFLSKYKPKKGATLCTDIGIDLSLLPPCHASLKMHALRVNYQALIWDRAVYPMPDIPSPHDHGWMNQSGELVYQWTDDQMVPDELASLVIEHGLCDEDDDENDLIEKLHDQKDDGDDNDSESDDDDDDVEDDGD